MKKNIWVFLVILAACGSPAIKNEIDNPLKGDWCFLDKYGNYTEAYFGDSTYRIYNKHVGAAPIFKYFIQNDSLYSNVDKRRKGLSRIAKIEWLSQDQVILTAEFVKDTLTRMNNPEISLRNTDPKKDSLKLFNAFSDRYEKFLISKGIITEQEAEDFKREQKIPEDVQQKLNGE